MFCCLFHSLRCLRAGFISCMLCLSMILLCCAGACSAVLGLIVVFWVCTLCWRLGVDIFIPGDLCSVWFGTADCLYCSILILCMMFVLDLRGLMTALFLFRWICVFGAGVLRGRFPFWISRACWAARMAKICVMFIFVCLLCLCAGQARSGDKVHAEDELAS